MKFVHFDAPGGPEVLHLAESAEPTPAAVGGFADTSQNAMQKAAIAPTPLVVDIALPKN